MNGRPTSSVSPAAIEQFGTTAGTEGSGRLLLGGILTLLLLLLTWLPVRAEGILFRGARAETDSESVLEDLQGFAPAQRESLVLEIRRYTRELASLQDSLGLGRDDISLNDQQRVRLERSIDEFSGIIEEIGQELSQMDLEISDNRISLTDEFGEGIVINIPENLDEHLSKGMQTLSHLILSELPDSTNTLGFGKTWDLTTFIPGAPEPPKKVVHGNIVKVWNDALICETEDVRGDVVVVMGDAVVSGRVDGNVVVVFGDLQLAPAAEVTGQVVSIGGRLDQDVTAEVGDLVVVDILPGRTTWGLGELGDRPLPVFLLSQGGFLLMLFIALLAVALSPNQRLAAVMATLRSAPGPSLGLGIVATIGLHVGVLILVAVLVITVIGLPLALLLLMAVLVLTVLATALAAVAMGEKLCEFGSRPCRSNWLAVVVGMIVLHAVSFCGGLLGLLLPLNAFSTVVMALGWGIKCLAALFGIGALFLSRFGSKTPAV